MTRMTSCKRNQEILYRNALQRGEKRFRLDRSCWLPIAPARRMKGLEPLAILAFSNWSRTI